MRFVKRPTTRVEVAQKFIAYFVDKATGKRFSVTEGFNPRKTIDHHREKACARATMEYGQQSVRFLSCEVK